MLQTYRRATTTWRRADIAFTALGWFALREFLSTGRRDVVTRLGAGPAGTRARRQLFKREIEASSHPSQWERKGASMFRPTTPTEFPQYLRVYRGLVESARRMGGMLFYYADEKPLGTPAQTNLNATERETAVLRA